MEDNKNVVENAGKAIGKSGVAAVILGGVATTVAIGAMIYRKLKNKDGEYFEADDADVEYQEDVEDEETEE